MTGREEAALLAAYLALWIGLPSDTPALGGFVFPRYTMPAVLQGIGYIFPLTYFIPIARGIFTKGIGIEFLWGNVVALTIFAIGIIFFAARFLGAASFG